jgi:hypothetical protein
VSDAEYFKRTSIPKKVANQKEVYCFNESGIYLGEDLSNQNILYKKIINRRFDNHYLNFGKIIAQLNRKYNEKFFIEQIIVI